MSYVDLVDETICALITTPGASGISVIRVSGPSAFLVTKKFCTFLPSHPESHKVYFGSFKTPEGELVDEALVTYFAKGRSFTGDETTEISVHGGFTSSHRVLSELLLAGCRAAERGEFSFRAFYNGKIDLVQAEAVLSIITSKSDQARSIAVQQLKGSTSTRLVQMEMDLISILAQLEASIDFSTEDIEPYSLGEIKNLVSKVLQQNISLLRGFKKGRMIQQGLNVILSGAPNVGKSSLYNILLGQEKAIVSATPGTTRDLLESSYRDNGMPIQLVDSAGLRETSEEVEKIGISKAQKMIQDADLIFYVLDACDQAHWDFAPVLDKADKVIFVLSKIDRIDQPEIYIKNSRILIESKLGSHNKVELIATSSVNSMGIQDLRDILEKISYVDIDGDEALITQHRHFEHLSKCSEHLEKAIQIFSMDGSYDLLALEIQCAMREIFAVLGKEYDDQVLDQIFKQFCIGK